MKHSVNDNIRVNTGAESIWKPCSSILETLDVSNTVQLIQFNIFEHVILSHATTSLSTRSIFEICLLIKGRRIARTTTKETPFTHREHRRVSRLCCWEVVAVAVAIPVEVNCPLTRRYLRIIQGTKTRYPRLITNITII